MRPFLPSIAVSSPILGILGILGTLSQVSKFAEYVPSMRPDDGMSPAFAFFAFWRPADANSSWDGLINPSYAHSGRGIFPSAARPNARAGQSADLAASESPSECSARSSSYGLCRSDRIRWICRLCGTLVRCDVCARKERPAFGPLGGPRNPQTRKPPRSWSMK